MNSKKSCNDFLQKLPKAELHVHIEGTLEPDQLLVFAERNKISLPEATLLSDDKQSYRYSDFSSFIATYLASTHALCTEQDFYEMTMAYLAKACTQGVVHTELYFEVQTYRARNLNPDIVVYGMQHALQDGLKQFGISGSLIFSLLCNETEHEALESFDFVYKRYKNLITTVGLAAQGSGNPVTKFKAVFERAHAAGYHCVAHCGEFGEPELMWQMLHNIPLERIDHGIACVNDRALMSELVQRNIALTVCPLSNVMLHSCSDLQHHPIKKIYDAGVIVTINSDDPAFFKGYIGDNYRAVLDAGLLSCSELVESARNSIRASFIDTMHKIKILALIDQQLFNHLCE